MAEMHLVAPDANCDRWIEISRVGFWLRHPAALDAGKDRPDGLEDPLDGFERLGNELAILEYDLTQCINEFLLGYQLLYQTGSAVGASCVDRREGDRGDWRDSGRRRTFLSRTAW